MAKEKRSIPAALAICIGPATAYLSFLIFNSSINELLQLICFGLFFISGYDLAKSRISLSGVLTLLLLPTMPIALYLNQATLSAGNHLNQKAIIVLWVASALIGAIFAGRGQATQSNATNVKRLAIIASILLLFMLANYWF